MLIGVFIIHYEDIYYLLLNISLFHSIEIIFFNLRCFIQYTKSASPPHSRVAGSRNSSKSLMLWRWPVSLITREISEDSLT